MIIKEREPKNLEYLGYLEGLMLFIDLVLCLLIVLSVPIIVTGFKR